MGGPAEMLADDLAIVCDCRYLHDFLLSMKVWRLEHEKWLLRQKYTWTDEVFWAPQRLKPGIWVTYL
jgi:hypothetical protein